MNQTCMCWGIEPGDGWYNIIDTLCGQIQWHIEHNLDKDEDPEAVNVEATQVKEKFGGLRFYYNGGNDFISGLVYMAESMSEKTCEECGSPGTQNERGWILTLCAHCRSTLYDRRIRRWETGTQGGDSEPTDADEFGVDNWVDEVLEVRQKHINSLDRLREEEGTFSVEEEDESN